MLNKWSLGPWWISIKTLSIGTSEAAHRPSPVSVTQDPILTMPLGLQQNYIYSFTFPSPCLLWSPQIVPTCPSFLNSYLCPIIQWGQTPSTQLLPQLPEDLLDCLQIYHIILNLSPDWHSCPHHWCTTPEAASPTPSSCLLCISKIIYPEPPFPLVFNISKHSLLNTPSRRPGKKKTLSQYLLWNSRQWTETQEQNFHPDKIKSDTST